jgi:glycerol-3-phosphate acyltransferase PlsY
MPTYAPILATLAAYLIGSLSFAVIVSRLMGLNDPRSYGSGNPGATNVLRSGNKKAAILTLLFDLLKGLLPVLVVKHFGAAWGLGEVSLALVGLAAFLGHLWPVFFRFQGGKGVATAAGVLLGIDVALGGATLAVWLLVAYFTRYSSLAAIVAAVAAPFLQLMVWGGGPLVVSTTVMGLLLIWRHSANIGKLLAGTESKLGQKAAGAAPAADDPAARAAAKHAHKHSHPHPPKKNSGAQR